jgi:hypothetical protein
VEAKMPELERGIEVFCQRNPIWQKVGIWIIQRDFSRENAPRVVGKIADWIEVDPVKETPESFVLSYSAAQNLMDELWREGFRPTEGTGSAGALAAVQKHLEDMRKIAFRKLAIDT